MWFGCNENHYADVSPQVKGMTMIRSFKPLQDTWPAETGGLHSLWSIRPDPSGLLAGQFDQQIISALQSAKKNSMLTAWHEASQTTIPSATMHKIHAYMHNLVHENSDSVKYGVVLTQGSAAYWAISGLDFYGIDLYDLRGTINPTKTLDRFNTRMPDGPIVVAETNSSVPHHRPSWFQEIFDWLRGNHGMAMLTFWNPGGPLSGPWLPTDAATIHTLNSISGAAAG